MESPQTCHFLVCIETVPSIFEYLSSCLGSISRESFERTFWKIGSRQKLGHDWLLRMGAFRLFRKWTSAKVKSRPNRVSSSDCTNWKSVCLRNLATIGEEIGRANCLTRYCRCSESLLNSGWALNEMKPCSFRSFNLSRSSFYWKWCHACDTYPIIFIGRIPFQKRIFSLVFWSKFRIAGRHTGRN